MTEQRLIIEMGQGVDLHGMDQQKAAGRAIQDALRHSSLPLFGALNIPHDQMRVQVTIGVPDPDTIDPASLAATLPRGRVTVTAVSGGHRSTNPETGDTLIIANAAIEAFLPKCPNGWRADLSSSE